MNIKFRLNFHLFRICNADTDDDVGMCTRRNTCESSNGVVAGECNVSKVLTKRFSLQVSASV